MNHDEASLLYLFFPLDAQSGQLHFLNLLLDFERVRVVVGGFESIRPVSGPEHVFWHSLLAHTHRGSLVSAI